MAWRRPRPCSPTSAQRADRLPRRPGLAVILVGDDPASHVYVRSKLKRAAEVGFENRTARFPAEVSEAGILAQVAAFNAAPEVDGILVQLPLPDHINTLRVMAAIDPSKDVDGLHALNAGKVAQGGGGGLTPCTPLGCLMLLRSVAPDLTGMNAVVLGSSNIVESRWLRCCWPSGRPSRWPTSTHATRRSYAVGPMCWSRPSANRI